MPHLQLQQIKIDGGTQSRVELNESVVADYAEVIRRSDSLPPVVVFFDGSTHWLADGFHRFHAHRLARAEEIEANVRTGTKRDAVLFSVGANARHGLRRTNEDKRRAVQTLLDDQEWSQWSDRHIAEACGVSHSFVAAIRNPDAAQRQQENRRASAARKVESDSTRESGADTAHRCNPITRDKRGETRDGVESDSSEKPVPGGEAGGNPAVSSAQPVADSHPDEDDDVPSLESLLEASRADNRQLLRLLEVAEASDQVAESLKWRRAYDSARADKEIAERRVRESERREKETMNRLRRCGKAVGEEDPRHIPAKVARIAAAAKEAGVWKE
ncbi:ParB/RepB/Spo0J family partition protein [Stenotrophomonas maltophilia]|uniref:ParB/RepB/Spo0J family partition protein n=1 Tax=Stenotrophomonas maltophilia TaxID=40324 RepID=UPI0007EFF390|nr:ParB/RepB/Spo0J family partition protein [Stenotrophomonas maltophilia]OBU53829.1 hypothetical protein A9K69_08565 [Stenotrophomonas maltophilia]